MNSRKGNSLTLRCSVFYLTRHVCKRSRAYPHGNPSFARLWFCFCIFHVIIQQCNIFWIVLWFVVVVHFLPLFIWDFSRRGGFTLYHPPSRFLLLLLLLFLFWLYYNVHIHAHDRYFVHAHFYIFLDENFRLAMEKVMKNRKPQSRLFFSLSFVFCCS